MCLGSAGSVENSIDPDQVLRSAISDLVYTVAQYLGLLPYFLQGPGNWDDVLIPDRLSGYCLSCAKETIAVSFNPCLHIIEHKPLQGV